MPSTVRNSAALREFVVANAGKMTPKEMANKRKVSVTYIYDICRWEGVDLTLEKDKRRWELIDRAIQKHYPKLGMATIAHMLGETANVVWSRYFKVKRREQRMKNMGERPISKQVRGRNIFDYSAYNNWLIY